MQISGLRIASYSDWTGDASTLPESPIFTLLAACMWAPDHSHPRPCARCKTRICRWGWGSCRGRRGRRGGEIQAGEAVGQEGVPGDGGEAGVGLGLDEGAQEGFVVCAEDGVGVAQGGGQAAEDLGVGQALRRRGRWRAVEAQIEVAVGLEDVPMLKLGGGGQDVVGVVGGVGLEVFEDDGEEIVPHQPGQDGGLVWGDGGGVGIVDDQGFDRGTGLVGGGEWVHGAGVVVGLGRRAGSGLRASPRAIMLRVRGVRPARRSGRVMAVRSMWRKLPLLLSWMPPPTSRQAPTRAGRQAMVRMAMPPPAWRCMP